MPRTKRSAQEITNAYTLPTSRPAATQAPPTDPLIHPSSQELSLNHNQTNSDVAPPLSQEEQDLLDNLEPLSSADPKCISENSESHQHAQEVHASFQQWAKGRATDAPGPSFVAIPEWVPNQRLQLQPVSRLHLPGQRRILQTWDSHLGLDAESEERPQEVPKRLDPKAYLSAMAIDDLGLAVRPLVHADSRIAELKSEANRRSQLIDYDLLNESGHYAVDENGRTLFDLSNEATSQALAAAQAWVFDSSLEWDPQFEKDPPRWHVAGLGTRGGIAGLRVSIRRSSQLPGKRTRLSEAVEACNANRRKAQEKAIKSGGALTDLQKTIGKMVAAFEADEEGQQVPEALSAPAPSAPAPSTPQRSSARILRTTKGGKKRMIDEANGSTE